MFNLYQQTFEIHNGLKRMVIWYFNLEYYFIVDQEIVMVFTILNTLE